MRSLTKRDEPEVLALNKEAWTAAYLAATTPEERRRAECWRHPLVASELSTETARKCAYCEAIVDDVAYAHVEHIRPKSVHPELSHHWPNLTSVCPRCNINKRDYDSEDLPLLNPYDDIPSGHLRFLGDFVLAVFGDQRAELTVNLLKLNRPDLVASRMRRIFAVHSLVQRWATETRPVMRELLAEAIRTDANEGEFTEAVSAYLAVCGFA